MFLLAGPNSEQLGRRGKVECYLLLVVSMIKSVALSLLFFCIAGCSDDDAALEGATGIYELQSYSINSMSCDALGESQLGPNLDGFFAAHIFRYAGFTELSLMSCADVADCRDKLAKKDAGELAGSDFIYSVTRAEGGELVGQQASTGYEIDGFCTNGYVSKTVVTIEGDLLTLVEERTIADDYPPDSDGYCTTDLSQDAVAGKSCGERDVLTAVFVEEL